MGSTLLSLSQMKTDGHTKFTYESRKKTSIRSVLNIIYIVVISEKLTDHQEEEEKGEKKRGRKKRELREEEGGLNVALSKMKMDKWTD